MFQQGFTSAQKQQLIRYYGEEVNKRRGTLPWLYKYFQTEDISYLGTNEWQKIQRNLLADAMLDNAFARLVNEGVVMKKPPGSISRKIY